MTNSKQLAKIFVSHQVEEMSENFSLRKEELNEINFEITFNKINFHKK